MRKTLTLSLTLIAFTSLGAIILFTAKPNAVPVGSDFFALQRNSDYINASVNQFSNMLYFNPYFIGNATLSGSWNIIGSETIAGSLTVAGPGSFGGLMAINGIYYGNGGGLTNVPGISGNFFAATNGVGQNPTFYGGGNFFGTYHFDEVDATTFFPTNIFGVGNGLTNLNFVVTTNNGGGNALISGAAPSTPLTCYLTNIAATTTLAAMTFWNGGESVIQLYCTASSANQQLKFPANFLGAGDLYGQDIVGTGVTVTNAEAAWFEIRCIYGVKTNVFHSASK